MKGEKKSRRADEEKKGGGGGKMKGRWMGRIGVRAAAQRERLVVNAGL